MRYLKLVSIVILSLMLFGSTRSDATQKDPRPGAWCGWWMRHHLGVSDRRYNLARSWATYGTAASGPTIGAIVVWPHHVGIITGTDGKGRWLITSGNDGGKVRTRVWNLRGARFRV